MQSRPCTASAAIAQDRPSYRCWERWSPAFLRRGTGESGSVSADSPEQFGSRMRARGVMVGLKNLDRTGGRACSSVATPAGEALAAGNNPRPDQESARKPGRTGRSYVVDPTAAMTPMKLPKTRPYSRGVRRGLVFRA